MREDFSLLPDFKIHLTYNFKHCTWYAKSGFPCNICGKGDTPIEALNNTYDKIADYSQYVDDAKGKELIKEILQSKQYIEYIGEFYLCILNIKENDWKVIEVTPQFNYKVYNVIHEKLAFKELLVLISNMKIIPAGQGGFDGRMKKLTIGSGFNSTTITWWSGDENDLIGLPPVLEKLGEIKTTIAHSYKTIQ